jgi:hypothetical protein
MRVLYTYRERKLSMLDQESKEQQPSETLTAEEIIQPVLVELSEEELLEVVTGGGGGFSRPQPESQGHLPPLHGVLVSNKNGDLLKSSQGNLIVAIPRSLSEPPLPVKPSATSSSSGQATSHENSSPSSDTVNHIFFHII